MVTEVTTGAHRMGQTVLCPLSGDKVSRLAPTTVSYHIVFAMAYTIGIGTARALSMTQWSAFLCR